MHREIERDNGKSYGNQHMEFQNKNEQKKTGKNEEKENLKKTHARNLLDV